MRLLVTRHGQTDWNVEKRMQGKMDTKLNAKGIGQAYETKEKLEKEKIDLIISSPLERARKTAEIINQNRQIPISFEERIIEIGYGENEGKLSCEIRNRSKFGNMVDGQLIKNAERTEDFIKRVFDFLEEIKEYQQDTILIVTHKEVCKVINIYFNGMPKNMDNCEVVMYEI